MYGDTIYCVCAVQIFGDYLTFAGIGLSKAQMFESVLEELNQSHVCLSHTVHTVYAYCLLSVKQVLLQALIL